MAAERKQAGAKDSLAERYERIYAVVVAIPRGSVSSYGEVAARAGLPRGARVVGRALSGCPASVPWHRVLNAAGRIALPRGSTAWERQARRLEAEGVEVRDGKVAKRYFSRQTDDLDALLWGPGGTAAKRRRVARPR